MDEYQYNSRRTFEIKLPEQLEVIKEQNTEETEVESLFYSIE